MSLSALTRGLAWLAVGLMAALSPTSLSAAEFDDRLMDQAIRYLELVSGADMSSEDAGWLKHQWQDEAALAPIAVSEEVDALAFAMEQQERARDPLALANARTELVKNVHCSAEQSSDPVMHRLRAILAPAGTVLAADCVLGLVATSFDVEGLMASHALTAAATGQGYDPERDRAAILQAIETGFASAAPADKALIATGEVRAAILARFWSRIEGSPEQRAVISEIETAARADLKAASRQLESLAVSNLADVDFLARSGDARLTAGVVASYRQWLERVAGFSFSARERGWLEQAIIDEFRDDPATTLGEIAGIKEANATFNRAETEEQKRALLAGWAAGLHCYLSSSRAPDEIRLAELVFRQDPVIEADCAAGRIRRESDRVLAEAGGRQLTGGDLTTNKRFASVILGRPLLPEEEAVIREDNIQTFQRDVEAWDQEHAFNQAFLAKIDRRSDSHFLSVAERKELFDPIYCALKASADAYADDYVRMFQRGGTILFEDCRRQLVTTADELDAAVSFVNFLNLLHDRPPLFQGEEEALRQSLLEQNLNKAESSLLAIKEWWALLSLDEKAAEVDAIKARGITPEADSATISNFLDLVKVQVVTKNAEMKMCRLAAIITEGNTAIYAARSGPNAVTVNRPLGIQTEELAGLVSTTGLFAELCGGIRRG